jgi:hypothetical protein
MLGYNYWAKGEGSPSELDQVKRAKRVGISQSESQGSHNVTGSKPCGFQVSGFRFGHLPETRKETNENQRKTPDLFRHFAASDVLGDSLTLENR